MLGGSSKGSTLLGRSSKGSPHCVCLILPPPSAPAPWWTSCQIPPWWRAFFGRISLSLATQRFSARGLFLTHYGGAHTPTHFKLSCQLKSAGQGTRRRRFRERRLGCLDTSTCCQILLTCGGFDRVLAVQLSARNNQTSYNLGSETTPVIHYLMSFDLDFRYSRAMPIQHPATDDVQVLKGLLNLLPVSNTPRFDAQVLQVLHKCLFNILLIQHYQCHCVVRTTGVSPTPAVVGCDQRLFVFLDFIV